MSHKEPIFDKNSDKFSKSLPVNQHILKPFSSSLTFRHHKVPLTSKSDPVNYRKYVPDLNNKISNLSNLFNRDDNQNDENETLPRAHFSTIRKPRKFPVKTFKHHVHNQNEKQSLSSANRNSSSFQQTILADAISPSVAGHRNIRFVTTNEREVRDREVTNALQIISQSMEPPHHNVDRYRSKILSYLKPGDGEAGSVFYRFCDFLSGYPFEFYRAFWHYVVLEIHLFYNLGLLYASFFTNPPLGMFIVGIILFWFKIIYELYRDIMHRDDALYTSNVPKELSLSAAISASIGFIIKMKSQDGLITEAWWNEPW